MVDAAKSRPRPPLRELREETGYGGGRLFSLGVCHPNPVLQGNRHHMFLARGVESWASPSSTPRNFASSWCSGERARALFARRDHACARPAELGARVRDFACERDVANERPRPRLPASTSGATERRMNATEVNSGCIDEVMHLLATMEELQARKVIDLARRLRPSLTPEDIRNPHDFPELDDTDWHFEDGQLAGLQSVCGAPRPPQGWSRSRAPIR